MSTLVQQLSGWANVWCVWMLQGLWQGVASVLVVVAILRFGRRWISAPLRYGLLVVLLVKLALPPVPGFPVGVFTWFDLTGFVRDSEVASAAPLLANPSPSVEPTAPVRSPDNPVELPREVIRPESKDGDVAIESTPRQTGPALPQIDQSAHTPVQALPREVSSVSTLPGVESASPRADRDEESPRDGLRAVVTTASMPATSPPQLPTDPQPIRYPIPYRLLLMLGHLAGFLAMLVTAGVGYWRWRRTAGRSGRTVTADWWQNELARMARAFGCSRVPQVWVSEAIEVPFVAGWIRPKIYLPYWVEESSEAERRAVLAHELAHVSRRDHWIASIQCLLVSWLWWNPLAWWLSRQIRQERERCCDDLVMAQGCCDRQGYADLLLRTLARASFRRWLVSMGPSMAEATDPLADRLGRIMDPDARPARLSWGELLITAAAAVILLPGIPRAATPAALPSSPRDSAADVAGVGEPMLATEVAPSGRVQNATTQPLSQTPPVPDLSEPALYELTLNVRDKSGAPVASADVTLEYGDGHDWPYDLSLRNGRWPLPLPGNALQVDATLKSTTNDKGQAIFRWDSRRRSCAALVTIEKVGYRSVPRSPLAMDSGVIEPGKHVAMTPTLARREDCAVFRGRIVDAETDKPVAGTVLADSRFDSFYHGGFLERRYLPVGPEGTFELDIDVGGPERARGLFPPVVLAAGYPVQAGKWELGEESLSWSYAGLADLAGKTIDDVRVTIKRGITVTARVVRAGGEPVGRAEASLYSALPKRGPMLVFEADNQGRMTLGPIERPEEAWFLVVTWPGYTRSHTVTRKPGETLPAEWEIRLPPTQVVRGRLVDEQGKPVTRASISSGVSPSNIPPPIRDWPNGEFMIDALTEPNFKDRPLTLSIASPGYAVTLADVLQPDEPLTIELEAGKPVGGRCVDPQGKPVAGARLIASFFGTSQQIKTQAIKLDARTDSNGVFWFQNFPTRESLTFSVVHPDFTSLRMKQFSAGKLDHQITLEWPLVIAAKVVDEVTQEQLGRIVVQEGVSTGGNMTWGHRWPVRFDGGQFELKFSEGTANSGLRILADGYQPHVLEPPLKQFAQTDFVLPLKRSHAVSVRVLTEGNQSAQGMVASIWNTPAVDQGLLEQGVKLGLYTVLERAGPIAAVVGKDGRARITNAPDGKHSLAVHDANGTLLYQEEIEVGPALATREHVVRVVPGVKPVVAAAKPVVLSKTPTPSTRVGNLLVRTQHNGKPLRQAQIMLTPKPGVMTQRNGFTGDDGTFLFGGLNPGIYEVGASVALPGADVAQYSRVSLRKLVQVDPEKTTEVSMLGEAGITVDGRLVDRQGKPLPGVFTAWTFLVDQLPTGERGTATAVPFAGQPVQRPAAAAPLRPTLTTVSVETGRDGKFQLPELVPGAYQVMFRKAHSGDAYQSADTEFSLYTHVEIKDDQPRVSLQFQPQIGPRLRPGDPAPAIAGDTPDGNPSSLAELRGKLVVISFWAGWNKPSLVDLKTQSALHDKFAGRDVVVLGVNLDSHPDDLKAAIAGHGIAWPQIQVPTEKVDLLLDQYDVRALPERILVGKDGLVLAAGLDDDELIRAIETTLHQ